MKDPLLALARYQNPCHVMFWAVFEPVVNYNVKPLTSVGDLAYNVVCPKLRHRTELGSQSRAWYLSDAFSPAVTDTTYSPGTGISISERCVITCSLTDTTYTADEATITISEDNVISLIASTSSSSFFTQNDEEDNITYSGDIVRADLQLSTGQSFNVLYADNVDIMNKMNTIILGAPVNGVFYLRYEKS